MDEKEFITDIQKLIDDYTYVINITKKDNDYTLQTILPYYYNKIDSIKNVIEKLESLNLISKNTYIIIFKYIENSLNGNTIIEK